MPTPVDPTQPVQPVEPATQQCLKSQLNLPEYRATQHNQYKMHKLQCRKSLKLNELPNTGTEDHASLAALGLLGVLSGFGLVARKKKED